MLERSQQAILTGDSSIIRDSCNTQPVIKLITHL